MCFVAGTKVKTFDGDKNIEDIEAGDYVFSKNTETGETGYKHVEEVFQNETPEIIRLEIAGEVIETTANHPLWVSGYGFKNAGCLKTGDVIETIDGNLYPVLSAERFYPTEDVKVYNFRVADWHTYYVSEIGILVHNDKCGPDVARRSESGSDTTRVGRWMSQGEYDKMLSTGKVQMSGDNKVHVANPADNNAFGKEAPKGSLYVEFDVPTNTISQGGKAEWGIINGPGSLLDRHYKRKGLPRITEMPNATNISIEGSK